MCISLKVGQLCSRVPYSEGGGYIGTRVLINKMTFRRGAYYKVGTYWKEGAESNDYGSLPLERLQNIFGSLWNRAYYYGMQYTRNNIV